MEKDGCSGMVGGTYSTNVPSVLPEAAGTNKYFFPTSRLSPITYTFPAPLPGNPVSPRGIEAFRRYFCTPSSDRPLSINSMVASFLGSTVVTVPTSIIGVYPVFPLLRTKFISLTGFPCSSTPASVKLTEG